MLMSRGSKRERKKPDRFSPGEVVEASKRERSGLVYKPPQKSIIRGRAPRKQLGTFPVMNPTWRPTRWSAKELQLAKELDRLRRLERFFEAEREARKAEAREAAAKLAEVKQSRKELNKIQAELSAQIALHERV